MAKKLKPMYVHATELFVTFNCLACEGINEKVKVTRVDVIEGNSCCYSSEMNLEATCVNCGQPVYADGLLI